MPKNPLPKPKTEAGKKGGSSSKGSLPMAEEKTLPVLTADSTLAEKLAVYAQRDWSTLIAQIDSEYKVAYDFMKPKLDEWALRLKLYNNQKRDKQAVGDPLMFTAHQTVLASLYSDRLSQEFEAREEGDEEVADDLNALAQYDYDYMQKDIIDYEWDWDAAFFGRGLLFFSEFDRDQMTPVPEVIDPMTFLRDPDAKSVNGDTRGRGAMRFGGRELRMTKNEMRDAKVYFNFEELKNDKKNKSDSILDRGRELRNEAQGHSNSQIKFVVGENETFRIMEWVTTFNNKKVIVGLADDLSKVVRFTELKERTWPIIDRPIYPMSHDWDGVSIPDLTEDKQRARAVLQNLGMAGIKAGLHPTYVYNTNKITNKSDLENIEMNKFIGITGDVNGAIDTVRRDVVKQDAQWILDVLDTAAQRATATPEIQQGVTSEDKRTFGEISLVASKVDTRYSLSAKIFGWSEKRFWIRWYQLYKQNFKEDIDEKTVRIKGSMGSSFRKLTRDNIVMENDPDVQVDSRVLSEEKRLQNLQMFRSYMKDLAALALQDANVRFALKRLGKLSGLTKDEIDRLLPPTYDELKAEDENDDLSSGKIVEVDPSDDDMVHREIHNRAADTPQKYAHMKAHQRNMLLKKEKPEMFPQKTAPDQQSMLDALSQNQGGIGGMMTVPKPQGQPQM